jgi:hypothetical protein
VALREEFLWITSVKKAESLVTERKG